MVFRGSLRKVRLSSRLVLTALHVRDPGMPDDQAQRNFHLGVLSLELLAYAFFGCFGAVFLSPSRRHCRMGVELFLAVFGFSNFATCLLRLLFWMPAYLLQVALNATLVAYGVVRVFGRADRWTNSDPGSRYFCKTHVFVIGLVGVSLAALRIAFTLAVLAAIFWFGSCGYDLKGKGQKKDSSSLSKVDMEKIAKRDLKDGLKRMVGRKVAYRNPVAPRTCSRSSVSSSSRYRGSSRGRRKVLSFRSSSSSRSERRRTRHDIVKRQRHHR